jgi:hypothetical protein
VPPSKYGPYTIGAILVRPLLRLRSGPQGAATELWRAHDDVFAFQPNQRSDRVVATIRPIYHALRMGERKRTELIMRRIALLIAFLIPDRAGVRPEGGD